jgi:hypothetical protein
MFRFETKEAVMMTTGDGRGVPVKDLILWPAAITLAVTLLRLAGELMGGGEAFFNRAPGGAGALVGIVWLVPVFGYYFGHRLARMGARPASTGRVFGYALAALVVFAAAMAAGFRFPIGSPVWLVLVAGGSWLAVWVAQRGWPALGRVLVAYGLTARVPVAVIMLFAILGRWGTHYDGLPPNMPPMGPVATWAAVGLVPQLSLWIAFTVIVGTLLAGVALAVASRTRATAPAAA